MAPKSQRGTVQNNPAASALRRRNNHVFRDLRTAESQATADLFIAQAQDLQSMVGRKEGHVEAAKILLLSPAERAVYQKTQREAFELTVKRCFTNFGHWLRYARWEQEQEDYDRLRDIFERAIEFHGTSKELWRHWCECEMRAGHVEKARSVLKRATDSLPQCDELWHKLIELNQACFRPDLVRETFQRWFKIIPAAYAWKLAVHHELGVIQLQQHSSIPNNPVTGTMTIHQVGAGSTSSVSVGPLDREAAVTRIRHLLQQLVLHHSNVDSWTFYAMIETRELKQPARAAEVLRTALAAVPHPDTASSLHLMLAEALEASGDIEGARATLSSMVKRAGFCSESERQVLFATFTSFERRQNSGQAPLVLTVAQAHLQYQAMLDSEVLRREEDVQRGTAKRVRPSEPPNLKYPPLTDYYTGRLALTQHDDDGEATFDALSQAAVDRSPWGQLELQHQVAILLSRRDGGSCDALVKMLQQFPHDAISNPHLWVHTAMAVAQRGASGDDSRLPTAGAGDALATARSIMGAAIAKCPTELIFRSYITLEDTYAPTEAERNERKRAIYQAWIDRNNLACDVWLAFAQFELSTPEGRTGERTEMLLHTAIRMLSKTAKEAAKSSDRAKQVYATLKDVDRLWSERLKNAIRRNPRSAMSLFEDLVASAMDQYDTEFQQWKSELKARNELVPLELDPVIFETATRRLRAALEGTWRFAMKQVGASDGCLAVRALLQKLVDSLRTTQQGATFTVTVELKRWIELELAPIFNIWREFEATYGTPESLECVGRIAEPPKKKFRIMK